MGKFWRKFLDPELKVFKTHAHTRKYLHTYTHLLAHMNMLCCSGVTNHNLRTSTKLFHGTSHMHCTHSSGASFSQLFYGPFSDKWPWSLARIFIIVFERPMLTSSSRNASARIVCKIIKKCILDFCKMWFITETVDQTEDYLRFHGLPKFLILIPIYCHLVPILEH